MPSGRLHRGEAEKREQFMESIFQKDPQMSAAKANDEFLKHFGSRMRNNAVYAIRARVQAARALKRETETTQPSGYVQPSDYTQAIEYIQTPQAPRGRRSYEDFPETKPVFLVTGNIKQVKFLNDTLEGLRSKGLSDLRVDHIADSYAVITRP